MDRTYRRGYDRDFDHERRYGRNYDRDYGRPYDREDRGFFDRAADEVRSWFGDEDAERRRHMDERYGDRYEARDDWRAGRDYDRGYDRPSGRYGRGVYPGRTADWDDEARRGYASGRYFYEDRDEARDYDRGRDWDFDRSEPLDDYERDYNRRYARDFGDHRGMRGRYERAAGLGGYDRPSGRGSYDRDYGREYGWDYDRGYRTGGRYPDYDAGRSLRDLDRDAGFRSRSLGYNRRSDTAY
ncbi:MAG TPA: SWFGD domain-containing protein [Rubricoccaceae bacterium]|nr:SWFGD domain-containing protein [Rubricoccaceae bacterium]